MRSIHVVINPASGRDEPVLAVLNRVFRDAGIEWSTSVTREDGDAGRLVREAAESGVDAVAIYGGDGSVGEAATALRGLDVPLAILPGGTGNVVSAELGIPQDLEAAASAIASGALQPVAVDALERDGRHFLLRVGVGADARMIRGASREQKDRFGWFAYLGAALGEAWEGQRAEYRVEVDGEARVLDAVTVMVTNIARVGRAGLRFSPDVDPTDGRLDVLVLRRSDLSASLGVAATMLGLARAGDRADSKDADPPGEDPTDRDAPPLPFEHLTGRREVRIEATPAQPVHGDGDLLGETPVSIRLAPGAVRILAPARPAVAR